jgi:hypothetical protein
MVYGGKNRIGRDASCCSVSVSSKVRLDYTVNVACHVLFLYFGFTDILVTYHTEWFCVK